MQLIGTKGCERTAAGEVDRARHDLLAGAALAADEHARTAARDLADQREDLAHRGALADQLAHRRGLVDGTAQPAVLLFERAAFECALEPEQQRVALERLGHVVEGAGVHRLDGRVDAAEGRHQHDRRVGAQLADLAEQLDPGAARHADVGEHHVAIEVGEAIHRLGGTRGGAGLDSLVVEQRHDHVSHCGIVVDHQNGAGRGRHALLSSHGPCQARDASRGRGGTPISRFGVSEMRIFGHIVALVRAKQRWHGLCTTCLDGTHIETVRPQLSPWLRRATRSPWRR